MEINSGLNGERKDVLISETFTVKSKQVCFPHLSIQTHWAFDCSEFRALISRPLRQHFIPAWTNQIRTDQSGGVKVMTRTHMVDQAVDEGFSCHSFISGCWYGGSLWAYLSTHTLSSDGYSCVSVIGKISAELQRTFPQHLDTKQTHTPEHMCLCRCVYAGERGWSVCVTCIY